MNVQVLKRIAELEKAASAQDLIAMVDANLRALEEAVQNESTEFAWPYPEIMNI